ncbi:hypothetical protein D0817_14020 [Flavobacterium cupreum]|uniref:SUEL-type lectin domain-containing protein n=3 Tax=Flavobacterium TaxID=237 RepID=A0A434A5X1_9FLAO|nr:T9SS sorting signal type C domain-containing protein [Flavobacterium cupreum]RUT69735.1 hypothetical protein D0817_14020 [Flavobacterium cupreum]
MIKKLLLFVRLLFLPTFSIFSLDSSRGKLSVRAKMFCFALLFCASFANAATYYSGINGTPTDANNVLNWWANTNGTGAHPANFTTGGDIFIVQTGHSMATTAAWAVTGNLQIQTGGTLSVAAFDITISGTTSITGSLVHSSNTGTKTYVGLVTINSGGLWNNSSNVGVIFRGGITNNGTFTSGSGVQTFNTNNQSLTGILSINRVTVTGVSLTNTNTLNVATALAGTGTLINSGTLNIGASTVGITTLTATAAGNTVNYTGAAQTIKSTSYYNLTFTGSGTKVFGGTTVATSNFINVAKGVQLDLSANNNHTARVLILGGIGPLISTWGAQGSGAANTTDTYFTNTNYGRIIVSGSGTFDPVIDSNYASYTKGVSGKLNASYVENASPVPVLTAPNGTVFINADFASYGTPAGTAPNFTLGTCNAFNSRTVATDVFLGNTTATIPATNATFGDPCVSIVKRLSVVATYTEPICINTSPGIITGSPPTGGNGTYTYLWEVSTTSAVSGYTAAPGTNNAKDYTPGNLTTTSWFRRTVYSGLYASETIVIVQVNNAPVAPTAIANTAFCAGSATTLTVSGGSTGGNGGYAQWYTGSCGGTFVGSGDSITVTPTAPTTYYVRYQNGCTTTACFSKLIEATVSITAAAATTPVCYNASAIQTTPLAYSATTGTPTTYSIAWNAAPTNSFVAVANAPLPASNISVSVPAGTNPGVYTGRLTVRNAAGTCVSLQNTFTVTVNALPTITGTANVCIGSTTQLTGSATPNVTIPWTSGTPAVATVDNSGLVTGVAAGTSVITYRNSNGCTQTVTVTVNALPTITGNANVCIGSTTQLTGSATPNATTPWSSGTPAVATVDNTGLVTGVAPGTSVITYRNANGCTQTVTVTVIPFPTIFGTPFVCVGSITQLTGSATPHSTTPWTSSTPSVAVVSNTGLVIGVSQGTSFITFRNSNGCTQTIPVTVNPQPAAPIVGTITQPTCVVPTGSVVLTGLPSTGTWTLTRSPGAVVTTGTGTEITISGLAANTTYTYTIGNGTCTSVSSNNIVVNQLPLLATWNAGWTNGPPTINQPVVFAGDYTSAGDLNSCSCTVNSGVNVVISDGNTLTVTNAVTVTTGATLTFENNSSLMQDSDVVNTGEITYKRTSSMRLSDFEYWSSPVKPQKLVDVSPLTLSDKYFGFNGDNWVITSPNDVMTVGKGYIIRGPQTYSNTVRADFTAAFKGVPNNGNLSGETLQKDKFYLIGNPYPSALSSNEFLKANSFINGTFYFWTHNTPLTISIKDYDADDYAVFNLTGGVATEGAPTGDDAPGNNPFIPQGHIAAGQSFFASTNDVGTVVFTNKMREGGANNSQFFKPGKPAKEEKSRIWLNITNDKGAFKQMLVGYIDGATNGIDNRYDGESFDANPYLDFYSVNNNLNYVIQGRALPFTDTDIVPLGYRSTIEGDFTISIQHTDGDLVNQPVYIEDKATGMIHNLKNGKYTFTTKAGTFTDRLVLRYTDKTLGTGDFENTENNILISVKNKAIKVTSAKENIKEVTVYDISGKLLFSKKKVSATELQITNLQSANQVLLVKVILDNEHAVTKKVIFQ